MAQVPSNWAKENSPAPVCCTQTMRFIHDTVQYFVATANVTIAASPYVPQVLTLAKAFTDDPSSRVLTIRWVSDASVGSHTATVRIVGQNQWGQPITEDVSLSQAQSLTRGYFTLNAFKTVSSATIIAIGSLVSATTSDTVSIGVCALAATMGTAGTQINGSSAVRYRGFGLMLPVRNTVSAASPTAANCEVTGVSFTDANVALPIDRGAGHLIDAAYGVFVASADVVLAGAGIYGYALHIQTNRGE